VGSVPGDAAVQQQAWPVVVEVAEAVSDALEGDLILGSNCRSAIATLVERQSRYTMLVHLPDNHGAITVRDGLLATIKTLPEDLRKSLTWDQGTELAQHREITQRKHERELQWPATSVLPDLYGVSGVVVGFALRSVP